MLKIFHKLLRKWIPLKPGTYEARLESIKQTKRGTSEIVLSNIKGKK